MSIKKVFNRRLKSHRWRIDIEVGNKRYQDSTFKTKQAALDFIDDLRANERAKRHGIKSSIRATVTLAQLITAREKDLGNSTNNRRKAISTLQRFAEIVGENTLITDIGKPDIQKFVQKMQEEKLQPSSINRYLNDLSAAIHAASKYFRVLAEWRGPVIMRVREPNHGREKVVSDEEFGKWLEAMYEINRDLADAALILLMLGSRPGEVLNLEWRQIDFEHDEIQFVATKTKTIRTVPMPLPVREILERRMNDTERVFSIKVRGANIQRAAHRAALKAGIRFGRKVPGGWTLYDLRHTAITRLLREGEDLSTVGAIVGHSNRHMTMRYSHTNQERKREAINRLAASVSARLHPAVKLKENQGNTGKQSKSGKTK